MLCGLFTVKILSFERVQVNLTAYRFWLLYHSQNHHELIDAADFERYVKDSHVVSPKSHCSESTRAWLQLIVMDSKWTNETNPRTAKRHIEDAQELAPLVEMDAEMHIWYINLPETLRWTPENIAPANPDFLFLQ